MKRSTILLLGVSLLTEVAIAMDSITIEALNSGTVLRLTNNSNRTVEALDFYILVDGKSVGHYAQCNLTGPLLNPGTSIESGSNLLAENLGKPLTFQIDGIAFTDGTIEGPNTWAIESYVAIKNQVARGGPVYPSNAPADSRGDAWLEAELLLSVYRRTYPGAPDPVVVRPARDALDTPGLQPSASSSPFPYMTTWNCYCYLNYNSYPTTPDGFGRASCNFGTRAPGVVQSNAFGACPQPNSVVPNKVTGNVSGTAAANCRTTQPILSNITKLYYGPDQSGTPEGTNGNLFWGAVADSTVSFPGGSSNEAIMIDSCIYASPQVRLIGPGSGTCN